MKTKIKVLFLDIDGVVNCKETFRTGGGAFPLDPYMAFLVGKIQLDTECKVVLSSSWRHHEESVEIIKQRVVDLLDITPTLSSMRGDEVNLWFTSEKHGAKYEVERYAILDDDSDFYDDQPLFQTNWEIGLTEEIAKQVTDYLNGEK